MNNTQREHNKIKNRHHEKANLFNGQISEREKGVGTELRKHQQNENIIE